MNPSIVLHKYYAVSIVIPCIFAYKTIRLKDKNGLVFIGGITCLERLP